MSQPLSGAADRPAVLAIDGGNSKTEVALVAADGTLLAQVRGDGSNPQTIGMDAAFAVLGSLVADAARQAGVPANGLIASHASACLAGADLAAEEQQLTDLVQAQGWTTTSLVVNDTFAVLRAGLDDAVGPAGGEHPVGEHPVGEHSVGEHWGVGLTCGAGINCVGVAPDGTTTRFLALGPISGDWGGGGDLAREALWWAVRAEDGRGPQTSLREAVPAHFGLPEVRDVTLGLYQETISPGALHGLVPVLFQVAAAGDQVARDLVLRQATEVCTMVITAARRLDLTGAAVPVALGGSVLTVRDPLLTQGVLAQLAVDLPRALPRFVDVPPVAGAALLGLDHVGASPTAGQRLRACYQQSAASRS